MHREKTSFKQNVGIHVKKIILCLVLLCFQLAYAESNEKKVGIVLSVKGENYVYREQNKEILDFGDPVFVGDKIETGFQAFIQIEFLDFSKINLMGSSQVIILDYLFDNSNKSKSEILIKNGALGFMVGRIEEIVPENFKVETTTASIGIRGSSGEIETSDGTKNGIEPFVKVMKTGGVGLTFSLKETPDQIHEITNTGRGIIFARNNLQQVEFKQSILQNFQRSSEGQFGGIEAASPDIILPPPASSAGLSNPRLKSGGFSNSQSLKDASSQQIQARTQGQLKNESVIRASDSQEKIRAILHQIQFDGARSAELKDALKAKLQHVLQRENVPENIAAEILFEVKNGNLNPSAIDNIPQTPAVGGGNANGNSNGNSNGITNGITNGNSNGNSNGIANGIANGITNGNGN